jgi:hypothetical protein
MMASRRTMGPYFFSAVLFLSCCGGIVIVDGSSGDAGESAAGGGGTFSSSGAGANGSGGTDAGTSDGDGGISDPEYCNMLNGPLSEDDGHPQTLPCKPWQDCCLEQSVGWWYCMSDCL